MTAKAKNMSPGPGPTFAASVAKALADFAEARGANRTQLMIRAGLGEIDLENGDGRIALARYMALMRAGQILCNDPALALHFGEAVDPREISIAGNIGDAMQTVSEGLARLNRLAPLTADIELNGEGERLTMARERRKVWLVDNRLDPNAFPEQTEAMFAHITCWTRRFSAPNRPFVKAIEVTHQRPPHHAEYDRVLGVPIAFGAKRNALMIDETWQARDAPWPSRYVSEKLNAHAEQLLSDLETAKSVRGRVEIVLQTLLQEGAPSIDIVAAKLGMNRKTLYRSLNAEGATYAKVLEALRRRLAAHYLSSNLPVSETARRLGFSDASAFSRAYKRWTGKSPRNARGREKD